MPTLMLLAALKVWDHGEELPAHDLPLECRKFIENIPGIMSAMPVIILVLLWISTGTSPWHLYLLMKKGVALTNILMWRKHRSKNLIFKQNWSNLTLLCISQQSGFLVFCAVFLIHKLQYFDKNVACLFCWNRRKSSWLKQRNQS